MSTMAGPPAAAEPRRPLEMLWTLPTAGDARTLGGAGQRAPEFGYMKRIAQALDVLGYHGVLLPTGVRCDDAWTTASALATHTTALRYLIALRPADVTPGVAARQAACLDRLSDGRLLLNVVAGGNPKDLAGDGIFLSHDARYEHAAEFLHIWRRLMGGETVRYQGRHLRVDGGRLLFPPVQAPHPRLYLGGASDPARQIAAEQCDVYLMLGEPPAAVAQTIADLRRRAAALGRRLRFGIRLHLIVRNTDAEAWAAAEALIADVPDALVAYVQDMLRRDSDSEGQRRMSALLKGGRDKLEVSPNLWAGIGMVRGNAGTALVGSPETVAERLEEYRALGIDTVIASGYPHLEEAHEVAERLFPVIGLP
jgi:alkanesulfonate monooxygenase